jgi:hypothetical protein
MSTSIQARDPKQHVSVSVFLLASWIFDESETNQHSFIDWGFDAHSSLLPRSLFVKACCLSCSTFKLHCTSQSKWMNLNTIHISKCLLPQPQSLFVDACCLSCSTFELLCCNSQSQGKILNTIHITTVPALVQYLVRIFLYHSGNYSYNTVSSKLVCTW